MSLLRFFEEEFASAERGCIRCKKPIAHLACRVYGIKAGKFFAAHEKCVGFMDEFRGIIFTTLYDPRALENLKNSI